MSTVDVVALATVFPMGIFCGWIAGFHHGVTRRRRTRQHVPAGRW